MKLSDHVDHLRNLIESAFDKQFARLGIAKNKQLDIEKLPEEVKPKRLRYEKIIENHIGETGDYEHARVKLIDELTFTLFNRLAAVKVMEAAALFPPVLTKQPEHGDRSFGHKAWLERNEHMRSEELEGIREYLKTAFDELGETLPLYSKAYPYALLPDAISLNEIIETFNEVEKDSQVGSDIWESDDVLGWMYESYNNKKKEAHKKSKAKTEYDTVSLQSQVYTPRWVVQFLVENSLGKLYLEMYPDSEIKKRYKIANVGTTEHTENTEKDKNIVNSQFSIIHSKKLPEIKLIDPACGSGNFLLYAFDFFYELYVDQIDNYGADYDEKDIPKLIIENNLHGIDLDDRAVQLAQLGLFIKARKKKWSTKNTKGTKKEGLKFNVVSSDFYLPNYETVEHIFNTSEKITSELSSLVRTVWNDLKYAYKFGSLIKITEVIKKRFSDADKRINEGEGTILDVIESESGSEFKKTFFKNLKTAVEQYAQAQGNTFLTSKTRDAITFLELLTTEYDVATANPPYTDSADFGPELKEFIEDNYKKPYKFHTNLYATFIKRCYELIIDNGKLAMIHPHTFMFIKTFEDVRKFMVGKSHVEVMVDFGLDRVNLFGPGILLDATFYVLSKRKPCHDSLFFNLTTNLQEKYKKGEFIKALDDYISGTENEHNYTLPQSKLKIIKSWPFIYWISDEFREKFGLNTIGQSLAVQRGCESSNNNRFLKFWWEIFVRKIDNEKDYYSYAKGGPYKKWFGNLWLTIDFRPTSKAIIEKKGNLTSESFYHKEGITSVRSGSKGPSYRYLPPNCVFDNGGTSIFAGDYTNELSSLAYLNSSLANYVIDCLNPTVNTQIFDIKRMPFVPASGNVEKILSSLAKSNITIAQLLNRYSIIELEFDASPFCEFGKTPDYRQRIRAFCNYENHLLTQVLLNEAIINEKIFEVYDLTEHDKAMVFAKEGESVGSLPVLAQARKEYLTTEYTEYTEKNNSNKNSVSSVCSVVEKNDFSLPPSVVDYIKALPAKEFSAEEIEKIVSGFATLYQNNNDLEEFCIRHQVNPINVWYWFKQSNVIPQQRMHTLAMEFLADMVREILMEDEDGIVPLVPNAGEKVMLDRIEEKFREKDFSSAQYSSFDSVLGRPIHDYLNKCFFAELSDHLNLFMYLPKTPFIWHLSSGPNSGFDCYLIIYKWSRDKLMRLRSVYIEHRERSLVNRQSDLRAKEKLSASEQTEADKIFKQLQEIEEFKKKIDELLAEGYNPILDDGVGKNIAPLQKKKMIPYKVLSKGQLKKYLNAEW